MLESFGAGITCPADFAQFEKSLRDDSAARLFLLLGKLESDNFTE